jgi:hypothetical protein
MLGAEKTLTAFMNAKKRGGEAFNHIPCIEFFNEIRGE